MSTGKMSSTTVAAQWTNELRSWKIAALNHVLSLLDHICAGPKSRLKSFAISDAVRHTVARDFDPESPTGLHLQHMLTGAIAQQLLRRHDLMPKFQSEFARSFPGSPADAPLDFMRRYVNSRWWVDTLAQMTGVCSQDLLEAVRAAIREAQGEAAQA